MRTYRAALTYSLSGFWHRYFRDIDDVNALFEGTELLVANEYLALLNACLGRSVRDTPLFRPEKIELVLMRESDVEVAGTKWRLRKNQPWRQIRYLQDGLVAPPIKIKDERVDFVVHDRYIELNEDPRKEFVRAATAYQDVPCGGVLETVDADKVGAGSKILVDGTEYTVLFGRKEDATHGVVALHPEKSIKLGLETATWSVVGDTATYSGRLVPAYGTGSAYLGKPLGTVRMEVKAIWALDSLVDDSTLYHNFGYMLDDIGYVRPSPVPSDEEYRVFLQGVMRLLSYGPTLRRLEEGLTAAAGLPLVSSDGERVVELTTDGVRTDRRYYPIPAGVPRKALTVGDVLRALQPLTEVVRIVDYVADPFWWHGIMVPAAFMPDVNESGRYVSAKRYPNTVRAPGDTPEPGVVGTPDVKVGDLYYRSAAYTATNLVLKHTLFGVKIDSSVGSEALGRMQKLLESVRPAHRYPVYL